MTFVRSFDEEHPIPSAVVELWRFASTDTESRLHLCGVLLEAERSSKTLVHAVATNGHILVHHAFPNPDLHKALGGRRAIVRATALKHASKRGAYLNGEDLSVRKVNATGDVIEQIIITEALIFEVTAFPDWRALLPKPHEDLAARMGLNPRYLRLIADYATRVQATSVLTEHVPGTESDPIAWDLGVPDGHVDFVLMPCRLGDDEQDAPEYEGEPQEAA